MSASVITDFRGYFISSSALTTLVPVKDIRIGWSTEKDTFPCVILQQSDGSDIGLLGYNQSPAGTKVRKEIVTLQIDVYSRSNMKNVYDIFDVIVPIMISGSCRKNSDLDMFQEELGIFRKTQTYTLSKIFDD